MTAPTQPPRPGRGGSVGGMLWSGVGTLAQAVGQFAVLAALARFVTPAEFGVVSAALIVIGLGRMVTEGFVGPALTQRPGLTDEQVRTGFALSLLTGMGCTVLLWLAAPAVAGFFHMPALVGVTRGLALMLVVQVFAVVPLALLQRELRFRAIGTAEALSFLLGFAPLGIGLAVAGAGVWSLVAANVGQATVYATVLLAHRRHPVALTVRWAVAKDITVFGGGHTTARYLNFVALQGDNFVVGRWMSDAALGLYGRAYQLASTPAALLGNVLDQVLFPTLAGRQHDRERLAENFRRAVCLTTAVTAPLAVVAVVLAPELIRIVLGPQWTGVVVAFQVLAGTLTFRTAYKLSDAMAKATGHVYARAWRQGLYATLVVGGAFACRPWGIEGVAAAVAGAIVVNYVVMSGLSLSVTGLGWASFWFAHLRGLMLATVTAITVTVSAAGLRAFDAPAAVVIAGASALALVAVVLPGALAPNRMLGPELMWLLRQMRSLTGGRAVER